MGIIGCLVRGAKGANTYGLILCPNLPLDFSRIYLMVLPIVEDWTDYEKDHSLSVLLFLLLFFKINLWLFIYVFSFILWLTCQNRIGCAADRLLKWAWIL